MSQICIVGGPARQSSIDVEQGSGGDVDRQLNSGGAAHPAPAFLAATTGTYVEGIQAVQRDTLDSMGVLFEHEIEPDRDELSSKQPTLSSRLS